ncbi:MAG: hypothetical protein ABSB74_07935 [Tepidisphaeraceae bacterium]|jgi:hypothetical protein
MSHSILLVSQSGVTRICSCTTIAPGAEAAAHCRRRHERPGHHPADRPVEVVEAASGRHQTAAHRSFRVRVHWEEAAEVRHLPHSLRLADCWEAVAGDDADDVGPDRRVAWLDPPANYQNLPAPEAALAGNPAAPAGSWPPR